MTSPDNASGSTKAERGGVDRIQLSRSQRNVYNGVLQDADPSLYLIGRSYQFIPQELTPFLMALKSTIFNNPVQLCILDVPVDEFSYPELLPELDFDDVVKVLPENDPQIGVALEDLMRSWADGIHAKPLVRHLVRIDSGGMVIALDVQAHHILLDGGATGLVEADLGRFLAESVTEIPTLGDGLTKISTAHRCESAKVDESSGRLSQAVRGEIQAETQRGSYGQISNNAAGSAARGVLCESVDIFGEAYSTLLSVSEREHVPLNILVAAAAVAVDSSVRQSTESLLIHAVDNRFGDPDLAAATCLVNSVAQPVHFLPFASVGDVVRSLDRGYVKAVRRRWLREEQYRRMYLAINRASHVEALTLNFLREPCAPELRPFLVDIPATTHIGPVESRTVASVLDEQRETLTVAIWDRASSSQTDGDSKMGERIAVALQQMARHWDRPIAMLVDEWIELDVDGALNRVEPNPPPSESSSTAAWFLDGTAGVEQGLERRHDVYTWCLWLIHHNVAPGEIVVAIDDDTDKTVDLLIACHLIGCGYSICDDAAELEVRARSISEHCDGAATHIVYVADTLLGSIPDGQRHSVVQARLAETARDRQLASKTAYIMPTSGSTGQPKLVRINHGSLARFCEAIRGTYGWGPTDTIVQCAPLTSDISVEEIFCGVFCGSTLIRSPAMKAGDLPGLVRDLVVQAATVVDLPTAIWHLLVEDDAVIADLRGSRLRQIVIGGEAVRPTAVADWIDSLGMQNISVISTYGPTEATVVATYCPIVGADADVSAAARQRVGRPIVPKSVFIAFGEIVIVGDLVAGGYLGVTGHGFGAVLTAQGQRERAFATADRIAVDDEGFPLFSGRRDALVKVSGKRVDTAEVTRRITENTTVVDIAVELHNGGLGVWFQTDLTSAGDRDDAVAGQIRRILKRMGVPSFTVVAVSRIPRKSNGKIDSDNLVSPPPVEATPPHTAASDRSAGLAAVWSRHLDRSIAPESSLLDQGIGSLDLIKILPDTRRYLGRHVSILDVISADTAAALADMTSSTDTWMDAETAVEIDNDFDLVRRDPRNTDTAAVDTQPDDRRTIVVLGASGVLGTGFAAAMLDLKLAGTLPADVVFVTRSELPQTDPWTKLRDTDGMRVECHSELDKEELSGLIRDLRARTVINCIGNTNVVVPYRDLRPANVELVSRIVEACANAGTRLVHLSTFVVNAHVDAAAVVDPRDGPYPYAVSKSLAELAVAGAPKELDYLIVRLPRVLGSMDQMTNSADILVSIAKACNGIGAIPIVPVTEEVTTAHAAATAIMAVLTGDAALPNRQHLLAVVRGVAVNYTEFLTEFANNKLDIAEWKCLLDQSNWAKRNPGRWSVIDAWITLGLQLGARSYTDYLAEFPTIELGIKSILELPTAPQSVSDLLLGVTPQSPRLHIGGN